MHVMLVVLTMWHEESRFAACRLLGLETPSIVQDDNGGEGVSAKAL